MEFYISIYIILYTINYAQITFFWKYSPQDTVFLPASLLPVLPPPPITPLQESTEKVKQFCEDVQNFSLYTFDYLA